MRPCLGHRCPLLVEPPRSRCDAHEQERNAAKEAQPHRWVYKDRRWFRCRRRALARAGYRCEAVEAGVRCPVTDTRGRGLHGHHHPRGVRELLELGLDPFDERRVVIVCDAHHGQIEALLRANR